MTGKKTKKGKPKKHTPITSKAQQGKFGAELGRRRAGKAEKNEITKNSTDLRKNIQGLPSP